VTIDYSETIAPEGDAEGRVLESLANGEPYVFIVTTIEDDGSLSLRVAVGGGLGSPSTIRSILAKTMAALPEES
jgi:hypothetical protein